MNMVPSNEMLTTGVQTARFAANFLPGTKQLLVDPALAAVEGTLESNKNLADLRSTFGPLRDIEPRSHSIRHRMRQIRGRWKRSVGDAVASVAGGGVGFWGGAAAGAALGTAIFPGPATILGMGAGAIAGTIGGGIGAMAGGYATNRAYNAISPADNRDAVDIVTQIHEMQQQGQKVPAELVFAALAANLPGAAGKKMEKALYRVAGTRDFSKAIADGKMGALRKLMNNPTYDNYLRADTGMLLDQQNANKSTAEQYAELINLGQIDARSLLMNGQLPIQPATAMAPAAYEYGTLTRPTTPYKGGNNLNENLSLTP